MISARSIAMLAVIATPLAPCAKAHRPTGPKWFVLSSLVRVAKRGSPDGEASAKLIAARGEWESFQLVVRAGDEPLSLRVVAEPIASPAHQLPPAQLFRVGFVSLVVPSNIEGGTGDFPDPLLPAIDDQVGEARNAYPVRVAPGDDATTWVDLFVDRESPPGRYRGALRLFDGERPLARVVIDVDVLPFELPATSSLPVTFGFSAPAAARAHFGRSIALSEAQNLTRRYALMALRHRISLHGGTMEPPPFAARSGSLPIDFSHYDAEVGPFLDGNADRDGPAAGARWTAFDLRTPARLDGTVRTRYIQAMAAHLRARGWIDRVFDYTGDEPNEAQMGSVRHRAALLSAAAPDVRRLVTHGVTPLLDGSVDVWCVPLTELERQPKTHGALWWYQSCLSHGCDIIGDEPFTGWPSYVIDAPPVAHRIQEWLTFRAGLGGELYYNTVEAFSDGDPWRDGRRHGGNGDGTLFYPGRPDRIGGRTDVPVASIRLKRIRDGLEDYEYLRLVAARFGAATADRVAQRIAHQPSRWDHDPDHLLTARAELARLLAGDEKP